MSNQNKKSAPYGSWVSPIHSSMLTQKNVRLGEPRIIDDRIYWLESRPQEKGRSVLVSAGRHGPDGSDDRRPKDLIPAPFGVFSRAHEYGGGSYCLNDDSLYFVNAVDQRIYQMTINASNSAETATPTPLTGESQRRFADLCLDSPRNRLIAVCEDHSSAPAEAVTTVVAIDLDSGEIGTLLQGHDFYSNPMLSPNGQKLSWLSWDHPHMPWDRSECWMGDLDLHGEVVHPSRIAGGTEISDGGESIFQPQWGPDGNLYFVSDRNNWWNIYRYSNGRIDSITCLEAEFATPQWVFGMSCFDFISDEEIIAVASSNGQWLAYHINLLNMAATAIELPWTDLSSIRANGQQSAVLLAASPSQASQVVELQFESQQLRQANAVAQSSENDLSEHDLSQPEAISFTAGPEQQTAHAFFYPPTNSAYCGPKGEQPPLVVLAHGGPTGATETGLNLKIQYWTSRGFAVADVNYRGSTGYGRDYREQLYGNWGITDVEDACAVVSYLAEQNRIDPDQVAIKGSSAGGYTVLAALTFTDTFKAGASLYGIGNLETLAQDTHKFEARYMDTLVAPYPEQRARYHERSPLFHAERLNCPVIFFQGLEDKVVPPNQAESMVQRLKDKQVPVAYLAFEGEGHGFRQADTIQRCLEAELSFYAQTFGFDIAESIEPVEIINPAENQTANNKESH